MTERLGRGSTCRRPHKYAIERQPVNMKDMGHAVMAVPGLGLWHYQVDFRFQTAEVPKATRA